MLYAHSNVTVDVPVPAMWFGIMSAPGIHGGKTMFGQPVAPYTERDSDNDPRLFEGDSRIVTVKQDGVTVEAHLHSDVDFYRFDVTVIHADGNIEVWEDADGASPEGTWLSSGGVNVRFSPMWDPKVRADTIASVKAVSGLSKRAAATAVDVWSPSTQEERDVLVACALQISTPQSVAPLIRQMDDRLYGVVEFDEGFEMDTLYVSLTESLNSVAAFPAGKFDKAVGHYGDMSETNLSALGGPNQLLTARRVIAASLPFAAQFLFEEDFRLHATVETDNGFVFDGCPADLDLAVLNMEHGDVIRQVRNMVDTTWLSGTATREDDGTVTIAVTEVCVKGHGPDGAVNAAALLEPLFGNIVWHDARRFTVN